MGNPKEKTPFQIAHELWQWIQVLRNSTSQVTGPESALKLVDTWAPPVVKLLQQLAGDLPSLQPLKALPKAVKPNPTPSPPGLNAFLKWEQLGKSETSTPRLKSLLEINKRVMKGDVGGCTLTTLCSKQSRMIEPQLWLIKNESIDK